MKYGSVCSGVEAATAAWHPLGWEPQWFSEIEKFPSAVLDHHYPDVPNYGDMTKFKDWNADTIDLLVGGTPCQSFSIAGLRKGLEDPRGNLMLTYLAMAEQLKPKWLVWENVPGVLSSNGGKDFGTFLSALGEIGYGFAYRVLDAQYFGLAQRRKRVFVVGYLGDWRRAAAVLFEPESLSGHPAPSREAREEVAQCLTTRTGSAYDPTTETLPIAFPTGMSGTQAASTVNLSPTLSVGHTASVAIQNATRGASQNGLGVTVDGPMYTLDVGSQHAVAWSIMPMNSGKDYKARITDVAQPIMAGGPVGGNQGGDFIQGSAVRRLTPTECERLQGFPDGYTQIPWRNKAPEDCPDGPRYKAMGNSMAVPVMRWIGERIQKTYST
jgi:DNA (cytosine-5)-methyltransferase 1